MSAIIANNQNQLGYRHLYESQQRGVTHLYESDATQFVAPMGFGKTAVALTAIGELIIDKVIDRALVVAPKRVAQLVWPAERDLWSHLHVLKIRTITGGADQRAAKLLDKEAHIYVIGVDHVPWLVKFLKTLPKDHPIFQCLVIDELSRFKNPRGAWSKAMRSIAGQFRIRWGLTGTPRPNGYEDQFAPLSIISANKLWGKSFDQWRTANFFPTDFQQYNWAIRPDLIAQIERDIGQYTSTVDISDMPDLPDLIERDHWIDLPDHVLADYREMERELVVDIDEGHILAANMGVATIKLAQIAQGFLYGDERNVTYLHNAKETLLEELVESLDGDPVLIVYEFQEDLARLLAKWPDLRWFGHNTTDAQARQNELDWNAGKLPMLALHPAAAGHGLNLQHGGHQMIWYGMTWSAELYDQTIKRIHRQGQPDHCFVHRILARDTIDEAKVLRVSDKISAQEAFKRYLRRV